MVTFFCVWENPALFSLLILDGEILTELYQAVFYAALCCLICVQLQHMGPHSSVIHRMMKNVCVVNRVHLLQGSPHKHLDVEIWAHIGFLN